ncbi:hypothetical protein IWX49DRAFT_232259 [Phyllosticta citricarpa]|uniref:Secreted protein n=1 Tax=Phyllosticta citricarpa TaxID=55181 RepID=A0ABR1LYS6_9PEZI
MGGISLCFDVICHVLLCCATYLCTYMLLQAAVPLAQLIDSKTVDETRTNCPSSGTSMSWSVHAFPMPSAAGQRCASTSAGNHWRGFFIDIPHAVSVDSADRSNPAPWHLAGCSWECNVNACHGRQCASPDACCDSTTKVTQGIASLFVTRLCYQIEHGTLPARRLSRDRLGGPGRIQCQRSQRRRREGWIYSTSRKSASATGSAQKTRQPGVKQG